MALNHGRRCISRVVIFASAPYLGHQLYDQRLARSLIDAGRRVVYVEPPVPAAIRNKWHVDVQRSLMSTRADGMVVVTPRTLPLGRRLLLAPFTATLVVVQVWWCLWRDGMQPTGVISTAAHPWTIRAFRRLPRVLVVKDDYVAGSKLTGSNPRPIQRRRRALLRLHDVVTVVSPTLADILLREGACAEVVPAGCEPIERDDRVPAELNGASAPRAIFTGMLSDRIDFSVLRAVVETGTTLVLAGRRQFRFSEQDELNRLIADGLVVELGDLELDRLNQIMAHCDIGLVPYTMSDFNRASFPLKTFEYLAAGIPVVATPLPSVLWLNDPHIHVSSSEADARQAILRALGEAKDPQVADECRATAARNTWDDRARRYLELLEGQVDPG